MHSSGLSRRTATEKDRETMAFIPAVQFRFNHRGRSAYEWLYRHRQSTLRPSVRRVSPSIVVLRANVLDGKALAATVREEIAREVQQLKTQHGKVPGLAVVIVGTRKDSQTYVRNKRKACEAVGMDSFLFELPESVSQGELEILLEELNDRQNVHGVLVQLPLPAHIDDEKLLTTIRIEKDVDGFHPLNIGRLCMSGREKPLFIPCTPKVRRSSRKGTAHAFTTLDPSSLSSLSLSLLPLKSLRSDRCDSPFSAPSIFRSVFEPDTKGCMELLRRNNIDLEGKDAVVLGRSNIVGLPVAMLLIQANATVTICHSRTKSIEDKVRSADIVVAAIGRAELVRGEWIKPGAVVIDVGINAVEDPTVKKGYRLVGDVEYGAASERASWITPVPGGVGPMTIAMLLQNTLVAAQRTFARSTTPAAN